MIEKFVRLFNGQKEEIRKKFQDSHPEDYKDLVRIVIEAISPGNYDSPDPERIHEIDDGDYQGMLVYVIGCRGYQPYTYWYVTINYGSCSGCDTLQHIKYDYGSDSYKPNEQQVNDYMTLALHIVQGLKKMDGEAV